jgi:hypothetical protein
MDTHTQLQFFRDRNIHRSSLVSSVQSLGVRHRLTRNAWDRWTYMRRVLSLPLRANPRSFIRHQQGSKRRRVSHQNIQNGSTSRLEIPEPTLDIATCRRDPCSARRSTACQAGSKKLQGYRSCVLWYLPLGPILSASRDKPAQADGATYQSRKGRGVQLHPDCPDYDCL